MQHLPSAWRNALARDATALADPFPERRLARLLAAFILTGLVFLVLPGTLLGVWNLVGISSRQQAGSVPTVFLQAHGHAQLFGWVGSFIVGISLYTLPKFRGAMPRSLALGWAMWGAWSAALAARWASAMWHWRWQTLWPVSAALELAVALLLIWQCSARGKRFRESELWNLLIFAGLAGLVATFALQIVAVARPLAAPLLPPAENHSLLHVAVWLFCFPLVWGYSTRFLPALLGLRKPGRRSAYAALALLPFFVPGAVGLACWSLRIFHPAQRPAKTAGVDRRYPWFARLAFGWLAVAAVLGLGGDAPGLTGASRHAFTVGFMATLIFAVGPRILPSFLNSRELHSPRLMLAALLLLTAGCLLRVGAQPLAYGEILPAAWRVLPVSATLELAAVLLFAYNMGRTLAGPMPAWTLAKHVHEDGELYWYVSAYPRTRRLLRDAGLRTLGRTRQVPRSLTLREAAEADGVDAGRLVTVLREDFERHLAKALRRHASDHRALHPAD